MVKVDNHFYELGKEIDVKHRIFADFLKTCKINFDDHLLCLVIKDDEGNIFMELNVNGGIVHAYISHPKWKEIREFSNGDDVELELFVKRMIRKYFNWSDIHQFSVNLLGSQKEMEEEIFIY